MSLRRVRHIIARSAVVVILVGLAVDTPAVAAETEYFHGTRPSWSPVNHGPIATTGGWANDNGNVVDWIYARTLNHDFQISFQAASQHWYVELIHVPRTQHYAQCMVVENYPGDTTLTCAYYGL